MAKKRDPHSLSSQAFAAIMGQGSTAAEPEPTPVVETSKPAPAVAASARAKSAAPVTPAEPVSAAEPLFELAPAAPRRGRPASKTPKRTYGMSLTDEDYEMLKEMAMVNNKTITDMLKVIINDYDRRHPDLREKYRKIQALLNS